VKWIGEAIPRTQFGQDLLHSFGAFLTICRIQRNNAEARINAMRESKWAPDPGFKGKLTKQEAEAADESDERTDLEEAGRDQIAQLIRAKFGGHAFARLVNAILKAQGYTTYLSPEGTDGGIDILAGTGALGFSSPRICVQVKSQESPIGRPEVDQLIGAMDNTKADAALFVAWGGFKPTVYRELANRFFRVRLWTQKELLEQLFATYEKLDEDLRAELPLKRVWTVAAQDEE
jgi:restriction system protein